MDAEPVTLRELEVLALVAEGYSNKLISAELGISERTVKNRLTNTMGKLRASDRTPAVVTATRLGWLEL
jgi:DNA-binding NarL/FixJ family response regulator